MIEWGRRMARYVGASAVLAGAVLAVGLPLLDAEGRRGLLLAVTLALVVQWGSFGALAALHPGSGAYLAAWVGGMLIRFWVIGVLGFLMAGLEDVDPLVALLTLAGLFFALLLLEPWGLRDRVDRRTNG